MARQSRVRRTNRAVRRHLLSPVQFCDVRSVTGLPALDVDAVSRHWVRFCEWICGG